MEAASEACTASGSCFMSGVANRPGATVQTRMPCCARSRAIGNVMPDLTIVIDVPTEVGLARIRQRASGLPDRMERENIDFYKKVREGYLVLARSMPRRFFVVNGTLSEEKVSKLIWDEVRKRIGI